MTVYTEKPDQWRRDAFIREPTHLLAVNDVFVSEIVGGKRLRRLNIMLRQSRVIREDSFCRHTGTQLTQDQFHRNARTANDRFAVHDIRANFDPFVQHGALSVRYFVQDIR
jgi:hypothetical protein